MDTSKRTSNYLSISSSSNQQPAPPPQLIGFPQRGRVSSHCWRDSYQMDMEELVVQKLMDGEREAQIEAASELAKLGSKQRHKLVERGVIAPLVSMLQYGDHEAIEAALFALLSLAFGSERNKIRLAKSGAIPVLLQLLHWPNKSLNELVIAALLILSSCKANKLTIASSGAIAMLLGILGGACSFENGQGDPSGISSQAKADAISTLHNLSTCHQNILPLVSSGAVPTLLQLIHSQDKSSELVEKALALLESILMSSEDALSQAADTDGSIRAFVEAVEEGSMQCKEHAASILLLMCQSGRDKYRGLILREGVVPGLLQLTVDGTWRAKDAAQELLLLLRDCSSYGLGGRQSKYEFLEQIMEEIDADDDRVIGTTTLQLVEQMIARLNT